MTEFVEEATPEEWEEIRRLMARPPENERKCLKCDKRFTSGLYRICKRCKEHPAWSELPTEYTFPTDGRLSLKQEEEELE